MWEAALVAGLFEQSVQRGGRDAGLVLELLGGYPGRRRAEHRDSCLREGGGDGVGGGRLAGAGQSDDADDAAAAGRDFLDHPLLLGGEDGTVAVLDLGELLRADRGDVCVAAALDKRQRRALEADQLGGRVAGRAARTRPLADLLDAVGADETRGEPPDALGRGAGSVRLRPGHHSLGVGERRLLLGQTLRPEQPPRDPQQVAARERTLMDPPEQCS